MHSGRNRFKKSVFIRLPTCRLKIGVNIDGMMHRFWISLLFFVSMAVGAAHASVPEGWSTLRYGPVLLHAPDDAQKISKMLGTHAEDSVKDLSRRLGVATGGTIDVFLPPTQEAFEQMQPGTPPSYADATAYPKLGAIYLRPPRVRGQGDEPLETVLDHELVHILLGRAFQPERPPAWLQEGVAQVVAGQYGPTAQRQKARTIVSNRTLSLERLARSFPKDPHEASAAYALSADFISWLKERFGDDVLRRLVAQARRGAGFQRAIETATRTPLEQLEKEWRQTHAQGTAKWWSAVTSEESVWAYMGMLALIAVVIARIRVWKRTRRVISEWRQQEAWQASIWPLNWRLDRDVAAMKEAVSETPEEMTPDSPTDEVLLVSGDAPIDVDDITTDSDGKRP